MSCLMYKQLKLEFFSRRSVSFIKPEKDGVVDSETHAIKCLVSCEGQCRML